MKTSQLVDLLVVAQRARGPSASLSSAALIAALACTAIVGLGIGVRPDFLSESAALATPLKMLFGLCIAAISVLAARRLGIPGRPAPSAFIYAWVALGVFIVLQLLISEPGTLERVWKPAAVRCVSIIAALSAFAFVVLVPAARKLAAEHGSAFGFQVGAASGAIASTAYALTCRQDDALFVSVWYGLAMLCAGGLGALLGRRVFSW